MTMKERDRAKFEARKQAKQEQEALRRALRRRTSRERGLEIVARNVYDYDRDDNRDISDET